MSTDRVGGITTTVPANHVVGRLTTDGLPVPIHIDTLTQAIAQRGNLPSGSGALASIADGDFLANTSGGTAAPVATTLTTFLDHVISAVKGALLFRGSSVWSALGIGSTNQVLTVVGGVPAWATASGGMLPLATGDTPGVTLIGTDKGECIGVPQ